MADSLLAELEALGEEVPPDLLEELEREIARNAEANRIAKEREAEAREAKERALRSKVVMDGMMSKYEEVRTRVEATKKTLQETAEKVDKQNHIKAVISDLKQRADRIEMTKLALKLCEMDKEMDACDAAAGQLDKQQQQGAGGGNGRRVDYAQTVQRLQTKLANKKREGEEQLREGEKEAAAARELARKREEEAKRAEQAASKKEQEAMEMRRKVENMQKLLAERKNKLRVTENSIEKKSNVVDKVEKILHSRERRANYVERRKVEAVMFARVPKEDAPAAKEEDKGSKEEEEGDGGGKEE